MHFKDLKNDYSAYLEYIYNCYIFISKLTPNINKYLQCYCKNKNKFYNPGFATQLEINLLYLEKILLYLDEIIENTDKINLLKMKTIKIEPLKKRQVLEKIDYIEEDLDIYVEEGTTIFDSAIDRF